MFLRDKSSGLRLTRGQSPCEPNSYILADSMEFPIGKKLPLWIVGLLY